MEAAQGKLPVPEVSAILTNGTHHSSLSSGASHNANRVAERRHKRAIKIRILALQESVGAEDELFGCSEFFSAITESCCFLDFSYFVGPNGNPRIGVPSVLDAVCRPSKPTRGMPHPRLDGAD
jgi:hypothetical protein